MISNEHSITSNQFTLQSRVVTICTTKFLIQEPALHPRSIYIYTTLNNSHHKLRSPNTFIRLMFVMETRRVSWETGNILNNYSDKFQVSNGNIRISQADKHYRSHKFKHSPQTLQDSCGLYRHCECRNLLWAFAHFDPHADRHANPTFLTKNDVLQVSVL